MLSPEGQFLVSTPNRLYYAEARAGLGPNPFHVHEFEFEEFRGELRAVFPNVTHVSGEPHRRDRVRDAGRGRRRWNPQIDEAGSAKRRRSAFLSGGLRRKSVKRRFPAFTYVPRAANMLRERERHIEVLEGQLRERIARVAELQEELASEQAKARKRVDRTGSGGAPSGGGRHSPRRGTGSQGCRTGRVRRASACAERTVEERTLWAQRNQAEADELRGNCRHCGAHGGSGWEESWVCCQCWNAVNESCFFAWSGWRRWWCFRRWC